MKNETSEMRERFRAQGYRDRRTVYPVPEVLERFPGACEYCDHLGLPHLVDNRPEFYWEHHTDKSGRYDCKRLNGPFSHAKPGTAVSLYTRDPMKTRRLLTEEEYQTRMAKLLAGEKKR